MANKSTSGGDLAKLGGLCRVKADDGKLVVAEILSGMSVSDAAEWASSHDAGPNIHHIADADYTMMSALHPTSVPALHIIDEHFIWKLPESGNSDEQIKSVAKYIDSL